MAETRMIRVNRRDMKVGEQLFHYMERLTGWKALGVDNEGAVSVAQVARKTTRSSACGFGSQRPLSGRSLTRKTCSRRCLRRLGVSRVDTLSANFGRSICRVKFMRTR